MFSITAENTNKLYKKIYKNPATILLFSTTVQQCQQLVTAFRCIFLSFFIAVTRVHSECVLCACRGIYFLGSSAFQVEQIQTI